MTTSFSHTGSLGDCVGSIPAMNTYYEKTGKKIILYLIKDRPFEYHIEGIIHSTKNKEGEAVLLNEQVINMLIPLLNEQECIEDARIWVDEKIDYALEKFRDTNVGMPNTSINRWFFYAFPDLACDLSKEWLTVPDTDKDLAKGKIIITRTERYQNEWINYFFLKKYEDELIFSGTMREWNNFCMGYDLNVKKLAVTNFLDVAQAIKQSRFHITNQTLANQISQGIFHPAIMETCLVAPNCTPIGKDRYDFLSQVALEYYFDVLYKKYL